MHIELLNDTYKLNLIVKAFYLVVIGLKRTDIHDCMHAVFAYM